MPQPTRLHRRVGLSQKVAAALFVKTDNPLPLRHSLLQCLSQLHPQVRSRRHILRQQRVQIWPQCQRQHFATSGEINLSQSLRLDQLDIKRATYPHIDMRETARHAARLLDATLRGQTRPTPLRARRQMLDEANAGRTDVPQTAALYIRATQQKSDPAMLAVSINAGFAEADILEAGPSVLVSYDQNIPIAAALQARDFDAHQGPLILTG